MDKDIVVYIVEYYSVIKKKKKKQEILPFATIWKDLDGLMLSEISQRQKDKDYMTSLI